MRATIRPTVWRAPRGPAGPALAGLVEPEAFERVLEGEVPDGRRIGRKEMDGSIHHRPGRNVTLPAPEWVSLMAMVGGDEPIVDLRDGAVGRTLTSIENNAIETKTLIRVGGVDALLRHATALGLAAVRDSGADLSRRQFAARLRAADGGGRYLSVPKNVFWPSPAPRAGILGTGLGLTATGRTAFDRRMEVG